MDFSNMIVIPQNREPAILVHYVALIGKNHGIVRIIHCRLRCGSLDTQSPLSLLLSLTHHYYCLWRIKFKAFWEKTHCTDLRVINRQTKDRHLVDFGFLITNNIMSSVRQKVQRSKQTNAHASPGHVIGQRSDVLQQRRTVPTFYILHHHAQVFLKQSCVNNQWNKLKARHQWW